MRAAKRSCVMDGRLHSGIRGFKPHESAFRHDSITKRSSELSAIIESLDLRPPVRVAGTHVFLEGTSAQDFSLRYRTGC